MLRFTLPALLLLCSTPGAFAADNDYARTVETARASRINRLTSAQGWLTLVGRHLLSPGENTVGTDAENTIRLAVGPPYLGTVKLTAGKVTFAPAPGAIVSVNGSSGGPVELVYHGENPSVVTFGTATFYVLERGAGLYLRVKDTAAERLRQFAGLDYFPLDPAWRIEAQWVPFDPPHQVPITNVLGQTSPATVPGKAVFTRDGRTIELLAIDEGPGPLFFVLTDLTAGQETYAASRFLYADPPKDGKIILDFNLLENPPCAFTPFATCPLPPKENRMPVRVTAGEKTYRGLSE